MSADMISLRPTTLPDGEDGSMPVRAGATDNALALMVAWCREEPWRVGEVLLVPGRCQGQMAVWFGRGPCGPDQPTKVPLGQLRPGSWLPSPPLAAAAISRHQLELRAIDHDRLLVRNVGRCPLLVDGVTVDATEVRPGGLLQLGRQLLLMCVRRTLAQPGGNRAPADFPFGEADAWGIVGETAPAWRMRARIEAVSELAGHVLVTGPSGSGKELVAQAIHARSSRAARPIVARNAATLPEGLIDAELFGNARNYPNPGMPERQGLIGEADRSTLFLDEIAELPPSAQAHLLRVMDAGEYQRLGESRLRRSDFRLVAATNRDLKALKHDLLARFTFQIAVPDLDARREDIPLLVRHLLGGTRVPPPVPLELARRLLTHRFDTGMRELRSLLWRALMVPDDGADDGAAADSMAQACHEAGGVTPTSAAAGTPAGFPSPAEVQKSLDANNGVIELSWRPLGLSSRFALLRLIKRYDIEVRRRPARGKQPCR